VEENYELFKNSILAVLRQRAPTHTELVDGVRKHVARQFEGNVDWHVMTVKLDLEARGVLERTRAKPQRYRLVE